MASTVKIESFDVNVTAISSQTHTLTNTVVMNNAFVRRTTSIDKQSGPTGSTSNANPNICSCAAVLSSTTQISFYQDSTTSQKVIGEVWRFIGSGGDPDEFIVHGRYTITLASTVATNSASVSGISNRNKCIPFWTGSTNTNTSVDDYDSSTVSVYIDGSDNIQVQRGATTGTLVVYVTVVEFTGSNWSVGHAVSSNHDTASETVTMNTASTGTGGSTFNVDNWETATIIEGSLEGDTSETGLSDNLGSWIPDTDTTKAIFVLHQDAGARNDGVAYAHVLKHPGLIVKRNTNTNFAEGDGTYTNPTWPSGASTSSSLDELALEWFSDTSGVGTAHARGRLSADITAATGTIQAWVHRSGNNVRIDYGVIDFTNVDGTVYIIITDVDTDEIITNTQANVVITATGGGFESPQGDGKVELVENSDYTGTKVEQTSIDSWSDTSIQFDASAGALADTYCFLFVTNHSGSKGYIAIQVGIPPETYEEAIKSMSPAPNFYWTFQNTYIDEIGANNANNSSGGSPAFVTSVKLAKGDTHSLEIASGDYTSPPDITGMNLVDQTRRYMGGWIQLDSVSQILSVIYEEGAQVNNIAFLNGFGNNLVLQVADTGDDYVQAYADKPLIVGRPYHVFFKFHANGYDAEVILFIDGVETARTNGNPWTASDLDAHSGNITWGHEGSEVLQVGDSTGADNVDIAFASPDKCYYAHWASWHAVTVSDSDIREVLFEKGAPVEEVISGDTEANMQDDMDALADTLFTDWPCSIEVGACSAGDFELTMDNITFADRVSMQVRYLGVDMLTLVAKNGTVLDANKLGAPYGGAINIINALPVTVTVKDVETSVSIQNARVLITADSGGDLPYQDSVTISRSGSTATVVHTTHGLRTGQKVLIEGAVQDAYNGVKTITVVTVNSYTYAVSDSPATPATGTITSTSVVIDDDSDINGEVTTTHRYTSSQPISGKARKGSADILYRTGNLSGTILSNGYTGTIFLVKDE